MKCKILYQGRANLSKKEFENEINEFISQVRVVAMNSVIDQNDDLICIIIFQDTSLF